MIPHPGSGLIAERHPQTQEIVPHSDEVILKWWGTPVFCKVAGESLASEQDIA